MIMRLLFVIFVFKCNRGTAIIAYHIIHRQLRFVKTHDCFYVLVILLVVLLAISVYVSVSGFALLR